jgi:4-aminobutyrate aminotransferase / (S)-3-amino-2-methylpropionate transaminase / 5-aminovalerate transaminase
VTTVRVANNADTVRLLMPLTASEMVLNEGLDILESAILGN